MSTEDSTKKLRLVTLEERVAELERKFDERGYDTRPIFEAHEHQLTELKKRIEGLEAVASNGKLGELTYVKWAYFTTEGDGPFCRHCYELSDGKKRAHLVTDENGGYCSICQNYAEDPARKKEITIRTRQDPLRGF